MDIRRILAAAGIGLLLSAIGAMGERVSADDSFEKLTQGQEINGFRVECLYDNEAGHAMGARLRHGPSGFVLDVLRIQSVPQAFMWVNTPPPSDQGEPHTMEHLLLGKGTRGRAVASLENMSLGTSSAFTQQLRTCYFFHTPSGPNVFYELLEAKLDAMLHPNYSDEEIRREVCNLGIAVDPTDGVPRLEEKGTVYNEMVSTYEQPWSTLWREMGLLGYGKRHPMALESGGLPDSIRTMTPEDVRRFHAATYHLANMGMIVAIPDEIGLADLLSSTSAIFARLEPDAHPGPDAARLEERLPAPEPAPFGTVVQTTFPHQNPDEPGNVTVAWPPLLDLDNNDMTLLSLFIDNLANGTTSDLYRALIDSQTRVSDIEARGAFGIASEDLGHGVVVGLGGVKHEHMTPEKLEEFRRIVIDEITKVAQLEDGSAALRAYNERTMNRVLERKRALRQFLNSPPGFGFRGTSSEWMEQLKHLQKTDGFRKSLARTGEYASIEALLEKPNNFWRDAIARWKLLDRAPYLVSAVPDPGLIAQGEAARTKRLAQATEELMHRYSASNEEEAIRRFQVDYDHATAEIDSVASTIPMPRFVDHPPMTLDDQLAYKVEKLPGGGPLVASTFENLTGATVGLAFSLDRVAPSRLLYIPALTTLLTEVGVTRDGKPLAYDAMREAIRREILDLDASTSVNYRTGRAELVVRATGTDAGETQKALGWIGTVLFDADWQPGNLPRIRDAVDVALKDLRNRMRGPEETWVTGPALAYWRQDRPLLLYADCFLTQQHALHRLRWMLMKQDAGQAGSFLHRLADAGASLDRPGLAGLAAAMLESTAGASGAAAPDSLPEAARALVSAAAKLDEGSRTTVKKAVEDLQLALSDIPDASLAVDWRYLCNQMATDLETGPERALAEIRETLAMIRHRDNVRGFVVASTEEQKRVRPRLGSLVEKLDPAPSVAQDYGRTPVIAQRLHDHAGGLENPRVPQFVGLMNENTRAGVVINSTPCASYLDRDPETLLRFVAARLYGGGGAHSMFMKTWSAGLAYSNGLRSSESTGRLVYYAERCPDLAQTVDFVVNELKHAPHDSSLAEYALAQAFSSYRSGSRYEDRGQAIAADLADGLTPDVVRGFRSQILKLRATPNLYEELHARMEKTYGEVLPGYGPTMSQSSPDALSFIIGPERQFASYEAYIRKSEGNVSVVRLYPRDFWIVNVGEN